jgi:hypothetical protein
MVGKDGCFFKNIFGGVSYFSLATVYIFVVPKLEIASDHRLPFGMVGQWFSSSMAWQRSRESP